MRDVILKALELAKAIAAATPTQVDDNIIATVDAILGNEAILTLLVDLIDNWLGDPQIVSNPVLTAADAGTALTEAEASGIGIGEILMIARLIMEIIDRWRNR